MYERRGKLLALLITPDVISTAEFFRSMLKECDKSRQKKIQKLVSKLMGVIEKETKKMGGMSASEYVLMLADFSTRVLIGSFLGFMENAKRRGVDVDEIDLSGYLLFCLSTFEEALSFVFQFVMERMDREAGPPYIK